MCGICGVYSPNLSTPEREIFQGLMLLNVFRGKDSTGVIRINPDGEPLITARRSIAPSPAFISSKQGIDLVMGGKPLGFIGHTRAATKGEVKVSNAHPFNFPNVIGVHNGTIRWPFRHSADYETDSEAIYRNINDYGLEDTLCELQEADPAYALVYVDRRDKTINFIKNKDRPLYFTFMYAKTTLIWSSQKEVLEFVLARRNYTTNEGWEAGKKGADGYFSLKEYHHLSIPIGAPAHKAMIKEVKVPERKAYYTTSSSSYSSGWVKGDDGIYRSPEQEARRRQSILGFSDLDDDDMYYNFRDRYGSERLSGIPWLDEQVERSEREAAEKNAKEGKGNSTKGGAQKPGRVSTAGGEPLSQSERNFRLTQGCFCCGNFIDPRDTAEVSRVRWWNREHFACGDCYENVTGTSDWVRSAIEDDWPDVSTLQ